MKRAATYLRVSRGEQSLENQRPDVDQLVVARGLEVVAQFEESASAARERPEFQRMTAHRGEFDVLVVWALDRLGRSMTGNLQVVLDLDRAGVEVVSVREPWLDMSGPVRSLLVAIFGWVAEQEREQIVQRTKAGIARARRKGTHLGRPRRWVDLKRAERRRASGWSFRDMARELGVPTTTLHRAMCSKRGVDLEGS